MQSSRWLAVLLVSGSVGLVGCEHPVTGSTPKNPTEVVITGAEFRDVTDYEEFTGHTDAILSVQIRARVTGYLDKKDFQDGQEVHEGDILYEIDDRPYKTSLKQAESMVAQGEAHRARLEADYRRASNLFRRAAIGKQEFDMISSGFAEAEAQLAVSKAQLDVARLNMGFTKVRAPMSGQLSRTLVDPGNLIKQDDTLLNDIVITDGVYVYFDLNEQAMQKVRGLIDQGLVATGPGKDVKIHVGLSDDDVIRYDLRLMSWGDGSGVPTSGISIVIVGIDDHGLLHIRIFDASGEEVTDTDETKLPATQAGAISALKQQIPGLLPLHMLTAAKKAELVSEATSIVGQTQGFPFTGKVNFSENKLDAATGTLRVRGIIKNPRPSPNSERILSPGLFVRVRLPIGASHPAVLVPDVAISSDQGRNFVYVVDRDDQVIYRPVEIGVIHAGLREIKKGLEADERIIGDSSGIQRVRPGSKVAPRVDPTKAAPSKASSKAA
jgi:multidrug efflux pump subunit AcrA (membrane-fusion protein)